MKQTIDPCTVLTAQEASKLAGGTLTKTEGGGVGSLRCLYTAGDNAGVQVTVKVEADAAAAENEFPDWVHPLQATPKGLVESAVTGLGDEASQTAQPKGERGHLLPQGADAREDRGLPAADRGRDEAGRDDGARPRLIRPRHQGREKSRFGRFGGAPMSGENRNPLSLMSSNTCVMLSRSSS